MILRQRRGFIFVIRGLLTHLTNEAELASVLDHEIGHVTARHSVQQMSRQQLAMLGLGLGSAISPTIEKYGQVASAGVGLLFLKYGRDDETQSEQLGFRYALGEGWDTREMANVFGCSNRARSSCAGSTAWCMVRIRASGPFRDRCSSTLTSASSSSAARRDYGRIAVKTISVRKSVVDASACACFTSVSDGRCSAKYFCMCELSTTVETSATG